MKRKNRILALLVLCALALTLLTGCGQSQEELRDEMLSKGSDVKFVKLMAQYITLREDAPEYFMAEGNGDIDLEAEPAFQPYFALMKFKAKADPNDKSVIHYSCRIPGLVGTAYNMAGGCCYAKNPAYSPWVPVEGTVRVVRGADGRRQLDVSGGDSVFALYAALRYMDPARLQQVAPELSGGVTEAGREAAVAGICDLAVPCYSRLLGMEATDYRTQTVDPELLTYREKFASEIASKTNTVGYGFLNRWARMPGLLQMVIVVAVIALGLFVLLLLILLETIIQNMITERAQLRKYLKTEVPESKRADVQKLFRLKRCRRALYYNAGGKGRIRAIQALSYPEDREVLLYLLRSCRKTEEAYGETLEKLPYPEERELLVRAAREKVEKAVEKLPWPEERSVLNELTDKKTPVAIRKIIVQKLRPQEDQKLLLYLAENDPNGEVRKLAMEKIPSGAGESGFAEVFRNASADMRRKLLQDVSYSDDTRLFLCDVARSADDLSLRRIALGKLPFPKERDTICYMAENDSDSVCRKNALAKLRYPEERDSLIRIAEKDAVAECRRQALEKLPYPQERAALARALEEDPEDAPRAAAAEKLPYPQERELLVRAARNSEFGHGLSQNTALKKLPYPEERDTLCWAVLGNAGEPQRRAILDRLPFPEERETLCRAACEDENAQIRRAALEKLSGAECLDAISHVLLSDSYDPNRRMALEKLPWPEGRETLEKFALEGPSADMRTTALVKLSYPESREALVKIATQKASSDEEKQLCAIARNKLPWLEEPRPWVSFMTEGRFSVHGNHYGPTDDDRLKGVIGLTFHPREIKSTNMLLRTLCTWIQTGMSGTASPGIVSLAGWAAAALGRLLTSDMTPDDIAPNQARLSAAFDKHNALVEEVRQLQKELAPYEGKQLSSLSKSVYKSVEPKLDRLNECRYALDRGIGAFMLENGDKPLAWLTYLLRDNQTRMPRFIKQGVIMGLVDWLSENASHPEAKKLLDSVVAVRSELIRSDNDLSFFELRVPSDCSEHDYAVLLGEVLHCANPSMKFADTAELLSIAVKEVPDCMEMLRVCPLRLIDPVNRQTLGFYKFNPFVHAMIVQYQPPYGSGKVIARYHEVDDRTKPLSSGLNLQLFRDPYAVIPTIFHEFQHFRGDPNEASVFLKTQLFSIGFYKKYRKAKAAADGVFAQMTEMLGLPPEAEKIGALNDTIERCYGKQVDEGTAKAHAEAQLAQINQAVTNINRRETWQPQIRLPLLNDAEDKANAALIRDIVIRFDTVPKSITKAEFASILKEAES